VRSAGAIYGAKQRGKLDRDSAIEGNRLVGVADAIETADAVDMGSADIASQAVLTLDEQNMGAGSCRGSSRGYPRGTTPSHQNVELLILHLGLAEKDEREVVKCIEQWLNQPRPS